MSISNPVYAVIGARVPREVGKRVQKKLCQMELDEDPLFREGYAPTPAGDVGFVATDAMSDENHFVGFIVEAPEQEIHGDPIEGLDLEELKDKIDAFFFHYDSEWNGILHLYAVTGWS
jgi:hypothetical protein